MRRDVSEIVAEDIGRLLERTAGLWSPLRAARVFVTGGTGFIGSWIIESLLAADAALGLGTEVSVLSRDPARFAARHPRLAAAPGVRIIAGDVRDVRDPPDAFTHVIHAATESATRLDRDDPATMLEVCREGTRRVLDLAERTGAARFLLVGSGAVYARSPDGTGRFDEGMSTTPGPGEPEGAYAAGKRAAEALCLHAGSRGIRVTIARCFAFVGPRMPLDTHFAMGNFIGDCIAGGPIVVRGDGTSVRSYLYAADLVEWLVTILLHGRPGQAYNVGGTTGVSIAELAGRVASVASELFPDRPAPSIDIRGLPAPGTAPERYLPDCTRAHRELGLGESTSLEEAVRRTMLAAVAACRSR